MDHDGGTQVAHPLQLCGTLRSYIVIGRHLLQRFERCDDGVVLRRYMDQGKFVDLLQSGSLYFSPASQFVDKREGHPTDADESAADKELASWGLDESARRMAAIARKRVAAHNQDAVVISCWTREAALTQRHWVEYGRGSDAVAIETTVGALRRELGEKFVIAPIQYIDFSHSRIPREHSLQPYFFKQLDFEWEQEVRLIGEMELGKRIETARRVSINLRQALRAVIVSPTSSIDYRRTVESMLAHAGLVLPIADECQR